MKSEYVNRVRWLVSRGRQYTTVDTLETSLESRGIHTGVRYMLCQGEGNESFISNCKHLNNI